MDDPLLNGLFDQDLPTITHTPPLPYMPRRNLVFFPFPGKNQNPKIFFNQTNRLKG
uniref:Uncharacterized protein n=1 Tax=Solanum tuberosum TaxID=4113 RepID=M1C492_SOLTU